MNGQNGSRFRFGANWRNFSRIIDERRLEAAEASLRDMLGVSELRGRRFLDIGSGSGLFSLAARRLGATVHSFDFDADSVVCTQGIRTRYSPDDQHWTIERGSVLDRDYITSLGRFDIVYCWGVLHHTGDLWTAMTNAVQPVAPGGLLYIALYNDQGWRSRYWTFVKRLYNRGVLSRLLIVAAHLPYLLIRAAALALRRTITLGRGMSLWYDLLDWLGGYPFEVSTPAEVVTFAERHELTVKRAVTTRRSGCNEFILQSPLVRHDHSLTQKSTGEAKTVPRADSEPQCK